MKRRVVLLVALLALSSSCRLFSREVACKADRDCPEGMSDCMGNLDGGVGFCAEAGPVEPEPSGSVIDASVLDLFDAGG